MPTATRYITPTATITGTTPDPDSAPTTYAVTINGQTISGLSENDISNITVTNPPDSTTGISSATSTIQIGQSIINLPKEQALSVISNLGIAAQSVNKSIITQATSGTDPNSLSSSGNPPQLIEAQTTNIPPDQIDGLANYQKVNPDTGQIYYGAPPIDPKELDAYNTSRVGNSNVEAQQTIAQDEIANQTSIVKVLTLTDSSMLPGPAIISEPVPWNPDEGGAPNPDNSIIQTPIGQINDAALNINNDLTKTPEPVVTIAESTPIGQINDAALSDPPPPPIQEPQNIPLPLGNDISDIYDPNLTPEQVASLSPGDQRARADQLGYTYTGPGNAATTNPDGSLTVTAPTGLKATTQGQATAQVQSNYTSAVDWRVRLTLASDADYLYMASEPGILEPLVQTNGVIFPYTPGISVNYAADYQPQTLTHSNYRIYQYKSSYVDSINITAEFTAQDTFEANYLLAVIHFFKSVTKMFYGQDDNPKNGTPPPLCYLHGFGGWQFDNHPLAIQSFGYVLPPDVDYIMTTAPSAAGIPESIVNNKRTTGGGSQSASRLPANVSKGGIGAPPVFPATPKTANVPTTWVPTKIQMQIIAVPMVSRNDISNKFSLRDYSSGRLFPSINEQNSINTGIW